MYIPVSAAEIDDHAAAGDLSETAIFEAKREMPPAHKTLDMAMDVAALACDGGVLVYGLGEDQYKRLTITNPFPLAGVRERIYAIVHSCVTETPKMEIVTLPTDADPTVGYVVIVIPPSPRAPHMVVKNGDMRFYGRGPVGNVVLSEGEVARLYARRQRYEVDRDALVTNEIDRAAMPRDPDFAYLYLVGRPVVPDEDLLDRAKARLDPQATDARIALTRLVAVVSEPPVFPRSYAPDMHPQMRWVRVADGFRVFEGYDEETRQPRRMDYVVSLAVDDNGEGHLFCGRAASRWGDHFLVFEPLIVGLTTRLLALLGRVYDAASYLGQVDVGVAVVGLQGAVSSSLVLDRGHRPILYAVQPMQYDRDEYRRTNRFPAFDLLHAPQRAARSLTERLYRTTAGEGYDPFLGR